jgi:hypothetical protein
VLVLGIINFSINTNTIHNISITDFIAKICSTSDFGQCTCIIILKCRRFNFQIDALPGGAANKSLIGLTGVTLTGTGTTNAKITSSATVSGRSIGLSGLYYFAPSDSFEPFVKLGVSAWNAQAKFSALRPDMVADEVIFALVAPPESLTPVGLCVFLVFIFGLGQRSNKKMKTQLKVVALSVLVATSTYAQENKDII